MTVKEKAIKFKETFGVKAVFVVEEIIYELNRVEFNYDLNDTFGDNSLETTTIEYFKEVKSHLESL